MIGALPRPQPALAAFTAILLGGIAVFVIPAVPAAKTGAARALTAATVIPAADLLADAALLRDAFETLHPGLRRYNPPAKLDAAFAELDAEFAEDRTLGDTYRVLSTFTAKLRCGHTWPSFFNQEAAVEAALFRAPRVPFTFRWIDGRMVVTRSLAGSGLGRGAEVLALDGTPARVILARLMAAGRADGGNDAKRVSTLEVSGDSRVEAFDVYYPLFFPMRSDSITLTVRRPGHRDRETIRVALLPFEVRDSLLAEDRHDAPEGAAPLWNHEWLDAKTALLWMPTWVTYNSRWNWQAALAETFDDIVARRGTTLIIDLRGNEGGTEEVGRALLARLVAEPLRLETMERRMRYRKVPDRLLPHLDTWDPSFKDWGNSVMEVGDGFYRRITNTAVDETIEPVENGFRGEVFVLVGAANSSATFQFAQAAQRSGRAKLVGQPTGGNQNGVNGGAFFFLRLPGSGIEIDLPLVGTFADGPRPDRGLVPDVPVTPSQEAIAQGVDAELESVRAFTAAREARLRSLKGLRRR